MSEKIHETANQGFSEVDAVVSPDGIAITLTAGEDTTSVNLDPGAALRLGKWLTDQAMAKGAIPPAVTSDADLSLSA